MKLIIKKDILLENLNNVSKAISTKNLIPILTGIKFTLTKEGLYLIASDNDLSIQCFIENSKIANIFECGNIVINGKVIVEIIRKLPEEDITIEVTDGYKMIISTTNTEFNLNGINPDEFPNLDLEETKEPIILEVNVFKNIINQTFFATSQNESRPLLTGINFKKLDSNIDIIATDSYRLAKKRINLTHEHDEDINIVIPGKNLLELSKMLYDDKSPLELHIFNNKILFKYKNILFLSRLLNGTYPATSSIIPEEFKIKVTCNSNSLYDMIDRASLLTSDREKNTIKLELQKNKLIIFSNSAEIGTVEEQMVIKNDSEIVISFSSKYMLDAIKSFNSKEIILQINDDSSPIVINSNEEKSLTQLVLPIKTY